MGFSEKAQVEGGLESENRKWVIAGIALRGPLKPIYTIPAVEKVAEHEEEEDQGDMMEEKECYSSTTPKGEEARIPTTLACPPAPRKQKPSLKCNYRGGGATEFFTPPDLETVFIRHVNWKG